MRGLAEIGRDYNQRIPKTAASQFNTFIFINKIMSTKSFLSLFFLISFAVCS